MRAYPDTFRHVQTRLSTETRLRADVRRLSGTFVRCHVDSRNALAIFKDVTKTVTKTDVTKYLLQIGVHQNCRGYKSLTLQFW